MKFINTTILLLLLLLNSCKSVEIFKENTEIAPKEAYKSFVIVNKEIGQKAFKDAFIDEKVSSSIQNQLESLGLIYDAENPELVIRIGSSEDPRQKDFSTYPMTPMWGWRVWDPWMYNPMFMNRQQTTSSKNYELVQLIVDFIDPKNDKMIMRLTAVSEAQNPREKIRRLEKSVEEVIRTYINHIKK